METKERSLPLDELVEEGKAASLEKMWKESEAENLLMDTISLRLYERLLSCHMCGACVVHLSN